MLTKIQREELDLEVRQMQRQDERWKAMNKKQTWWDRNSEFVGLCAWSVVGLMVAALAWYCYGISR